MLARGRQEQEELALVLREMGEKIKESSHVAGNNHSDGTQQ